MEENIKYVNIGTRAFAKTKIVNMFTAKMTVSSTLMVETAETKVAKKGTEIHVEIGMMKVVGEKKIAHTCIRTHMSQVNDIPVETEEEKIAETEVIPEVIAKKEVKAEEIAVKEVLTLVRVGTKVTEKEIIQKDVTTELTAEKEEEAEKKAEEKVKAEAPEVSVKVAVNMIVKKVLICRGSTGGRSWSRRGLYWHTPAGVVRSRDLICV